MLSVFEYSCKFLDKYIEQWFNRPTSNQPLIIFISGPQGSGKSYNGNKIHEYLNEKHREDKTVAYCSIDDFYLTHEDQQALAQQYKGNKLLQGRGLPGTHDLTLLNECLSSILLRSGDNTTVKLPRYDKSQFSGEGDRSEETQEINLPVDIFIVEGWFLGYQPLLQTADSELVEGDMADINAKLFMYSDLLWRNPEVHSLGIVFGTDDINNVYSWRTEQEHETKQLKGDGMSDEEVVKFVDRYMPCYDLYFDEFVHSENLGSVATLTIGIDKLRNVYSTKTKAVE